MPYAPSIRGTSRALTRPAPVTGWEQQKANLCGGRSWGCTGWTDFPGSGSSWSPASGSPRWSWPPPCSRTAPWGHTCGKLPSGCSETKNQQKKKQRIRICLPSHTINDSSRVGCQGLICLPIIHRSDVLTVLQVSQTEALITMATASLSETTSHIILQVDNFQHEAWNCKSLSSICCWGRGVWAETITKIKRKKEKKKAPEFYYSCCEFIKY